MAEACRPYSEISIQALYDYKATIVDLTDMQKIISIQALYDYKQSTSTNIES